MARDKHLKVKTALSAVSTQWHTVNGLITAAEKGGGLFWMEPKAIEGSAKGLVAQGPKAAAAFIHALELSLAIAFVDQAASGGQAIQSRDTHPGR